MTRTVTVYTKPDCARCVLTCLALDRAGIGYVAVDVDEDDAARAFVVDELGYTAAPVVVVDQDPRVHWSGFRRDRIAALAASVEGPAAHGEEPGDDHPDRDGARAAPER